ncbi:MAG: GNAT family N-acetyltransferase [Clostridia bacterium]|nr:GNAT family N-acetyltransferase [Clostridia bacterium]
MIRLAEIDERNFFDVRDLDVGEDQRRFLDSPLGILARGYVYRAQRARVLAIRDDGKTVGLLLVKDMDEAPACYDLQQFMIDRRFQGRGYGAAALGLLLERLRAEKKYPVAEVCVHRKNAAALALFRRAGFLDTGYVDPDAPDCLNLMCRL